MGHRHDPSTDNYIAFNNTGQGWWDGAEAAQTALAMAAVLRTLPPDRDHVPF